jgi:hypothetical protein
MNLSARDAALHLLAGPLCAAALVEHLRWFFGWDTESTDPHVLAMLRVWGRVAGVPYTGPRADSVCLALSTRRAGQLLRSAPWPIRIQGRAVVPSRPTNPPTYGMQPMSAHCRTR